MRREENGFYAVGFSRRRATQPCRMKPRPGSGPHHMRDINFGAPARIELIRRADALWVLLKGDPIHSFQACAVSPASFQAGAADRVIALTRLQAYASYHFGPREPAAGLWAACEDARLHPVRSEQYWGRDGALPAGGGFPDRFQPRRPAPRDRRSRHAGCGHSRHWRDVRPRERIAACGSGKAPPRGCAGYFDTLKQPTRTLLPAAGDSCPAIGLVRARTRHSGRCRQPMNTGATRVWPAGSGAGDHRFGRRTGHSRIFRRCQGRQPAVTRHVCPLGLNTSGFA